MKRRAKTKTTIVCQKKNDESEEVAVARMVSSPEFNSAFTNNLLNGAGSVLSEAPSLNAMIDYLEAACTSGDTGERALTAQAIMLDKLFNHLLQSAFGGDASKSMSHIELWLKYALRAQSQCRATYDTVSAIRHPRVQLVREQYNARNMQVNNSLTTEQIRNPPNELTEKLSDDIFNDTRTKRSGCHKDTQESAVAEINGAEQRRGKIKVGT